MVRVVERADGARDFVQKHKLPGVEDPAERGDLLKGFGTEIRWGGHTVMIAVAGRNAVVAGREVAFGHVGRCRSPLPKRQA